MLARIEVWAPAIYQQEREALFQKVSRDLGDDALEVVLAAVTIAYESSRRTKREKKDAAWYWKRREKIERQLKEIAEDVLVRTGPEIESVVFYEPHEVDCVHGRRTKTCVTMNGKLVQYRAFNALLNAIAPTNPLRRGFERRAGQLLEEIKAFDPNVSPEPADPASFCAPTSREIVDGRARAELDPTWHRERPGRPPDTLQRYLLETVGEFLYRREVKGKTPLTRDAASEIVKDILTYCFDERDTGDLERRWREWRSQTPPTRRVKREELRSAQGEASRIVPDSDVPGPRTF